MIFCSPQSFISPALLLATQAACFLGSGWLHSAAAVVLVVVPVVVPWHRHLQNVGVSAVAGLTFPGLSSETLALPHYGRPQLCMIPYVFKTSTTWEMHYQVLLPAWPSPNSEGWRWKITVNAGPSGPQHLCADSEETFPRRFCLNDAGVLITADC